jgi:large subunit ribosomal protein L29
VLAKELRAEPDQALKEKAAKLREEIFNLHFKATTEPIDNPARIRAMRRDIARIETVLTERKLAEKPRAKKRTREERRLASAGKQHMAARAASKGRHQLEVRRAAEKAAARKAKTRPGAPKAATGAKKAAPAKKQG